MLTFWAELSFLSFHRDNDIKSDYVLFLKNVKTFDIRIIGMKLNF